MNIHFISVDISRFRSINNIHLDLDNQGIVIVKGVNDYEEIASSNGSGKSSIFEAIIFALFEETSSGEKDVANRILNNGYEIKLEFYVDDALYTIIRSMSNNKTEVKLYKNEEDISARTKTDTNKLILEILGITKDIFLDSIFLSQNVITNLATLSPTARKERLELLTNTSTIIDNFKDTLKTKQLVYEQKCTECQLDRNKLEGNKETIKSQITNLQNKIYEIEKEQQEKLALGTLQDIENEIKDKENEIEGLEEEVLTIINESEPLQKQYEELNNKQLQVNEEKSQLLKEIMNVNDKYNNISSNIDNNNRYVQHNQQDINRLLKEIEDIKSSDTCPTCGRKYENFDDSHIKQTILQKEQEIEKLKQEQQERELDNKNIENQLVEINNEKVKIQVQEAEKGQEFDNLNKQCRELLDTINNMNTLKDTNNSRIQVINRQIQQLQERKQLLQTELNNNQKQEYEKMIQEYNQQLDEIEVKQQEIDKIYATNNDYVEVCKNSIQLTTKEFRVFLLKNSIDYINVLLQKYSKELFSNEKDIISIKQDDSKLNIQLGDASYESLSGGEKTKVDIALLLSQKSLANVIGNISSNIIILDEILKFCDSTTEINIVDLLSRELDTLESIFMISHKEIPIGYDKQIIVNKDTNGLSNLL